MTGVLHHVHVENWRVVSEVDLALRASGATWLVGRNGSGKSSLLDALAFLADVVRLGPEARLAKLRGHADDPGFVAFRDLLRDVDEPATWQVEVGAEGERWRYTLVLAPQADGFTVVRERLERRTDDRWSSVLEVEGGAARWIEGGSVLGDGAWTPVEPPLGAPLLARSTSSQPTAHAVAAVLRGTWLLRLDPLLMRGSRAAWKPGTPLERYGRDLGSWAIHAVEREPDLRPLFGRVAEALGWRALDLTVRDGQPRLEIDEGDGSPRAWTHASDGETVHVALALLSLFLPDELHVLLLDEPAVAVDRDAAKELAAWIAEIGSVIQVLVATQELTAVDQVSRADVLLVRRERGSSPTCTSLADDERAREVPGLYKPGATAWEVWDSEGRREE